MIYPEALCLATRPYRVEDLTSARHRRRPSTLAAQLRVELGDDDLVTDEAAPTHGRVGTHTRGPAAAMRTTGLWTMQWDLKERLNIVSVLYRWSMKRFVRRRSAGPVEMESLLAANKDGVVRPRRVVLWVLAGHILEIGGCVIVVAVAALLLAPAISDRYPALSSAFDLVGATLSIFPLSLFLAVGLWTLPPESRPGGFFDHPQRLWIPSIMTYVITIAAGLLLWRYPGLIP